MVHANTQSFKKNPNLSIILKVGQDNGWTNTCLSKAKLIICYSFLPLIVNLEQLPLTCASSVEVILSPVNSGMNQVAGTARWMSNKGAVTTKEQL